MHLILLLAILLAAHAQAAPSAATTTVDEEKRANPIFIRDPEDITSGDILAGTAGTISGERRPLRERMGGALEDWWNGPHMLGGDGNRFGPNRRQWLKDHGLSFDGNYQGAYFGVVSSQSG